jgi:hypothetical protein
VTIVQHLAKNCKLQMAMALFPMPTMVNVAIRPAYLYEVEEIHLRQLYAAARELADAEHPDLRVQGEIAAGVYASYLTRLSHPFLMRVGVVAQGKVPMALARALGTTLTYGFLGSAEDERGMPAPGYDIQFPARDELSIAVGNLRLLEMDDWGYDLAIPPYRRFRYLVDTKTAHCAFRLPFVPKGGIPGVLFGQGLDSEPAG